MSFKEASRRKRSRVSTGSLPPPPASSKRKTSSRIASNNERASRKSTSTPEADLTRSSSRKRGRGASNYPSTKDDLDAKRKREKSPTSSAEIEDEIKPDPKNAEADIDEAGELKIDQHGNLLEGREFKVPTFKLPNHGDTVLMLAMEPTKVLGYRDSYLFFHKHPSLERIRINDDEKKKLVDMGMLVTWFKNRDVAVVTARSVFKCFGHKIVKRGRRVKDDYYETEHGEHLTGSAANESRSHRKQFDKAALENEKNEAEVEDNSRKSLIGKTARSEGYSSAVPLSNETWMHHAALAARGFNAQLHERRAGKPTFYDIHSNINQVPSSFQPKACHFELTSTKDDTTEPIFEFKPRFNKYNTPIYRGIGKDLLDYDVESVISELANNDEERDKVKEILANDITIQPSSTDDNYPLALMEGQFQANFPIHQARFNYPIPKIPDPSNLIDTAQSLAAQQYYLGLVYQSVNQFADPQRQSPIGRSPQTYSSPPLHVPQPPQPTPPPQMMPHPRMPINALPPEPPVCRTVVAGNQICRRPVSRAGEKCQLHAPSKQMSDFTKGPPPNITYSDNKCADCHQLRAVSSLFRNPEERITDDFAVVKCSKCTRKYHPICANLSTPRQVAAVESYPWSCPECKICCVCKSAGDESTLMICDGCDRGWHTGCCNPKVDHVPEGSWLCPLCANCHSCDEHGMADECQYTHATAPKSDRYKYPVYLATYCPKCNDNFKDDRFCPVCLKTYAEEENDEEDNEMVACDSCDHWVHTRCDETLTPEKYQILCDEEEAKYSCPMCEDRFTRLVETSTADLALKGLSAPSGFSIGLLGGKVKTRGIMKYKDIKVGVPEINGTGIAEMPSNHSK